MVDSDNADLLYDPGDEEETLAPATGCLRPTPLPSPCTRYLLLCIAGESLGRVVPLEDPRVIVGRGAECHVVLKDSQASRQHARILRTHSGTTVEDLASLNGTFVNGKRIVRSELISGDIIRFGRSSTFRFSVTDAMEEGVLRQLYESSALEPLTGAYRHADLELRLAEEVSFVRRHGVALSLLAISVAPDSAEPSKRKVLARKQLLALASAAISSTLGKRGHLGLLGAESFAAILPRMELEEARAVAEQIRLALAALDTAGEDEPIHVSPRLGGACHRCCDPLTAPRLLELAAQRLQHARATPGEPICFGPSPDR